MPFGKTGVEKVSTRHAESVRYIDPRPAEGGGIGPNTAHFVGRHEAEAENSERVEKRVTDAGGADRDGAVGQPADHPAQLSQRQRDGDPQHGTHTSDCRAAAEWWRESKNT